jgi:2-dehydro-3-deoxygluconokinase
MAVVSFKSNRIVAIGEAMIEMAPNGADSFRFAYAGDTFNTAWHIGQLLVGAEVAFVTKVGDDNLSDRFLEELRSDGLDTSAVSRDPNRSMGLYLIQLDGAERSFNYWRKDSAATHLADDRSLLSESVGDAGLIHVSGITLAILSPEGRRTLLQVLAGARAAGAIVSFDPNVRPRLWKSLDEARESIRDTLEVSDIVLPSFDDESKLWGDISTADTVARVIASGPSEVVVKNGAGAISFAWRDGRGEVPTMIAESIRDTTGAGDAFNAGYLVARHAGKLPAEAVELGQRIACEVLKHPGARAPKEALVRHARLSRHV